MEHMMMRLLTVLIAMALLVPVAQAEPSSLVAFDVPTLQLLSAADAARGEALAKEKKCYKCHGDNGVSEDPEDVNIAGMQPSYIYKQLRDYQDGNRDSRSMYKQVRDLDDRQMADLAAWFALQQPLPPAADRNMDPAVLSLVYEGDPARLLKACSSCHGRRGQGGQFDSPRLTGQYPTYFIDSMTEFQEGDRSNDIYARMRSVAEVLTEEEIEALAGYYSAAVPVEEE
jgi:cytochrome c553